MPAEGRSAHLVQTRKEALQIRWCFREKTRYMQRPHLPFPLVPGHCWVSLVFLFPGMAMAIAEALIHDLDPYPVEADGTFADVTMTELHDAGLFLRDPSAADRAGVWISESLLRETGVSVLEDLLWLVPGAHGQARFGNLTVPTLRGDASETLFNGQRRGDNLFGIPPTRTLMGAVEVIKGPPPVETGLGKRTGGTLNLGSPQARTEGAFGSAEIALGAWVPEGGSYGKAEVTLDGNVPIGERQALRLRFGFREDETFYGRNGGTDDYRDLYVAWRYKGDRELFLDLVGYVQTYDRPQTLGVNRPWQGLIADGAYFTGDPDPLVGSGDAPGPFDPGVADPGLLTGGSGSLVQISRDRVLMSAGDEGFGDLYLGQGRLRVPMEGGMEIRQSLLLERVSREKMNQFYYAEEVGQTTVDSLTSLRGAGTFSLGPFAWETGVSLRLEKRENRANYWNEFAYAFDISEGRRFSTTERFGDKIAPGAVSSAGDRDWYLPSSAFSTPESTDSRLRQAGLYGRFQQQFGETWELRAALRIDRFWIEAAEPGDLGIPQPLSDSAAQTLLSGSVSLQRDFGSARAYLTVGSFRGIAGNTVGDGINLYADGRLHRDDFLNRTELLEAGGGFTISENLTASGAVFAQSRRRQEFFGSNDLLVRGAEASLSLRLGSATRFHANASYLDARYENASPAEFGGGSLWNVYAAGAGPTGEGNGLGYIGGFFLNSQPPGDYRLPGLPRWQANFGMEHRFSEAWLIWIWGAWSGKQYGNLAREYTIPAQWEWNASLSWEWESVTLQVVGRNLLDAENWIHNGDTFFNQMLISRNLPFRLELVIRRAF